MGFHRLAVSMIFPPTFSLSRHIGFIAIFDIGYATVRLYYSSRFAATPNTDFSRQARPTLSLFLFLSLSLVDNAIMYAQSRFLIDATYLRRVSLVTGGTRETSASPRYLSYHCQHIDIFFFLEYILISMHVSG